MGQQLGFSIEKVCSYFEISRQAYYKRLKVNSVEQICEEKILILIREIRINSPKIGGKKLYFLIKKDIDVMGLKVGRDAFFEILKKYNLLVVRKRKYVVTTQSFGRFNRYKDHYNKLKFLEPNRAWVSDITYIRVNDGFKYLFLTTDACSRKIVGWALSDTMEAKWAVQVAKMALKQVKNPEGLIHHSDRGFQYVSKDFTGLLNSNKMLISMGEKGNCYDNALAARINGILKMEYLLDCRFPNEKTAQRAISQAISNYNNKRPHWALDLKTPNQVHNAA